jgi:hypothetical protein
VNWALAPLAACALLGAAPAAAQTREPAPAAQPPERAAAERPRLNLKLDNPGSWATVAPDAGKAGEALPSLGADARPQDRKPGASGRSPFPHDATPGY